jgi:hypothetical protein
MRCQPTSRRGARNTTTECARAPRRYPPQGFIFCLGHDLTPHLLIRGRGAVRIHFKDVIGVKSISRTGGRKKAAGLEVSEGPSEFLSD